MLLELPNPRPGDEIEARHLALLYDALRRVALSVAGNSGLSLDSGDHGTIIGFTGDDGFYIELTANSGGAYAWTEQLADGAGTWVAGYRSGTTSTDPAYEMNGNTSIPSLPQIVHARRLPSSNAVVFQLGSC